MSHGQRIALMRRVQSGEPAEALRARILDFLEREEQPELSDIRVIRSAADVDERSMPPFMAAYLQRELMGVA